jgi:hypothetical protein
MSYRRVIPRDLFNEADLLKCYGRLWLCLDNLARGHAAQLGDDDGDHDGAPFRIEQGASGDITVANVPFKIHGNDWRLTRPLNSREPWPLYAENDDECVSVFTGDGELSAEFRALIRA